MQEEDTQEDTNLVMTMKNSRRISNDLEFSDPDNNPLKSISSQKDY